jgi:hypothetical protein
MPEAKTSKRSI